MASAWKYDNRALLRYTNALPGKSDQLAALLAADWQGFSRQIAPVDTGALRNSIMFERIAPGVFRVYVAVEYGIFVELGTYRMHAQPFFYPGATYTEKRMVELAKVLLAP